MSRRITEIIIHCADTPEGRDFTVADIEAWHRQRGFRTVGYHFVIYRDGSVHRGRPVEEAGAHCLGHNANSVGVCYIGGCVIINIYLSKTDDSLNRLCQECPSHLTYCKT